jgi:putative ABC transport system permease protein
MPPALLWRGEARFLARHPVSVLLAVVGIGLGVGVALAVELSTRGALVSFDAARSRLDGGAWLRVFGSDATLPETALPAIVRGARGLGLRATPVLSGVARRDEASVQVVGVDPLTDRDDGAGWGLAGQALGDWLAGRTALVSEDLVADRHGTEDAPPLRLQGAGGAFELTVGAVVGGATPARLVLADVSRVQEILGLPGRLSYVDLHSTPWTGPHGSDAEAAVAALEAALPAGMVVRRVAEDRDSLAGLTAAFRMNLRAMAWLAVLVGALLSYQLYSVLCEQRLPHFGGYRLMGVTAAELITVLAVESFGFVLLGTTLGAALGTALAQLLTGQVAATMADAWRLQVAAAVRFEPGALLAVLPAVLAAALAMGAAALRLARVDPLGLRRRVALDGAAEGLRWRLPVALLSLIALLPLLQLRQSGFLGGLVAIGLLILVLLLLLPALARRGFAGLAGRQGARGGSWRLPLRQSQRQRRGLEQGLGALVTALAVALGMGVMIDSFRGTLLDWLDERLAGDLYARLAGQGQIEAVEAALREIEPRGVDWLFYGSGFAAGEPVRWQRSRTEGEVPPWPVLSGRAGPGALLATEPLARRQGWTPGDTLSVRTAEGSASRTLDGVVRDFALGPGQLLEPGDGTPRPGDAVALAVYLEADARVDDARTRLAAIPGVEVRANREIRDLSLRIFEETFAVTRVIEAIALVIAVVALITAAVLEQRRSVYDLGLLRALGMSRGRLLLGLAVQAGCLAGIAWLVAVPLGAGIGWMLVEVVNPRAFHWTLDLTLAPRRLLDTFGLAAVAAVCAALLPVYWVLRRTPAQLTQGGRDDV